MKKAIIQSLLDTDLYKFSMMQVFLHQAPGAQGEYRFVCRNNKGKKLGLLADAIREEIKALCSLRFTEEELAFMGTLRYIKSDFVDWLRLFQFQERFITVESDPNDPDYLNIVAKGPLLHVMLFEIFVLAIVNELYFRQFDREACLAEGRARLAQKIATVKQELAGTSRKFPFLVSDFGVRRRFSREWQEEAVGLLVRELPDVVRGTSNVDLARRLGVTPIGTMAHEYLQAHQAFGYRLRDFQKMALENWVKEYRGDLGIALTDVVGMDAFLADFDLYFAKLFDGLRHDSGDPYEWAEKAIAHYQQLKIDPTTKSLVFSDGLTFPAALALWKRFGNEVRPSFGIGTNLTNDMGPDALNIVMKLVACNGSPVAKLSDSAGKTICDDMVFLSYLAQVFHKNLN